MQDKRRLLHILFWNFVFIIIVGFIRFEIIFKKFEDDYLLIFYIVNIISVVLFSFMLGLLAKNYFSTKTKINLLKFMWLFYIYSTLSLDLSIVIYIFPLLFLFTAEPGIDTFLFSTIIRFIFSIPLIFFPAYITYKSKFTIKNFQHKLNKIIFYFSPVLIVFIIFSFGAFIFSINPVCAITTYVSQSWQDSCYIPLATITRNSEYCHTYAYYSDNCVNSVAKIKNDPLECLNVYDKNSCIEQFFTKNDSYNVCYSFENYSESLVDECVDNFVGWNINVPFEHDLGYYTYLKNICDTISYDYRSSCTTVNDFYETHSKLPRNEEPTLNLIKKYKEILKDEKIYMESLYRPPDLEFCKLQSILSEFTVFKPITISDDLAPNPYSKVCFANYGKYHDTYVCKWKWNSQSDEDSWRLLCLGGKWIQTDGKGPYGYFREPLWGIGAGIASIGENITINITRRYELSQYSHLLDSYYGGIEMGKNLKSINFCDEVKQYQKECKEIVNS